MRIVNEPNALGEMLTFAAEPYGTNELCPPCTACGYCRDVLRPEAERLGRDCEKANEDISADRINSDQHLQIHMRYHSFVAKGCQYKKG